MIVRSSSPNFSNQNQIFPPLIGAQQEQTNG